jgi:hypothetical protein
MRRQKKMNILSDLWGQVYGFISFKFHLNGKTIRNDLLLKRLQTGNTGHADALRNASGGKEPPLGEANIKRVVQGTERQRLSLLELQSGRILFPLEMQRLPLRNLA